MLITNVLETLPSVNYERVHGQGHDRPLNGVLFTVTVTASLRTNDTVGNQYAAEHQVTWINSSLSHYVLIDCK